jgi:hypothetical protein
MVSAAVASPLRLMRLYVAFWGESAVPEEFKLMTAKVSMRTEPDSPGIAIGGITKLNVVAFSSVSVMVTLTIAIAVTSNPSSASR